jgi:hypothetical protein
LAASALSSVKAGPNFGATFITAIPWFFTFNRSRSGLFLSVRNNAQPQEFDADGNQTG